VTPAPGASLGEALTLRLTATCRWDRSKSDVVALTTTCMGPWPDATIDGLGDDVIDPTGAKQTAAREVAVGRTATYSVRAHNRAETAQTFRITGPGSTGSWPIQYLDDQGADITSAVTGTGWDVAVVGGAYTALQVLVTPPEGTEIGAVQTALVACACAGEATKVDVVGARTTAVAYQPDAYFYRGPGRDVVNTTGEGQEVAHNVHAGESTRFAFTVRDLGRTGDTWRLTGPAGAGPWAVRYAYEYPSPEGRDITAQVTGEGAVLACHFSGTGPHADYLVVTITAAADTPDNASFPVAMRFGSEGDPSKADVLVAVATCIPAVYQVDAVDMDEATPIGDGVYNDTGDGQTLSRTVAAGARVTHDVRLYNDGNATDYILINSTPGDARWTIKLVLHGTGWTSDGWKSYPLSPGAAPRRRSG